MKTGMSTLKRNRVVGAGILLVLLLALAACNGQATALPPAEQSVANQPAAALAAEQPVANRPAGDLTRTNEGGAVTFLVRPLNLDSGSATLDFEVDMDTHSVDLGFDLASMAVLKTDTGVEISPSAYQGGGGHHVKGRLSFPADQAAGTRTLTLVISNAAGVAERLFTWQRQ